MKRPAVFFDRDGTLCVESGYINHPSRLRLEKGAARAVRTLSGLGFRTVVVTNQAGIARGYFSASVLDDTSRRLEELLAAEGARLDAIYACTHHPDVGEPPLRARCDCRKPRPGMLERAARDLDIDLARSFMVGDSFKDVGAGAAAGVAGIVLLRTGYGRGELLRAAGRDTPWPDHVADDLAAAVSWIEARAGRADGGNAP